MFQWPFSGLSLSNRLLGQEKFTHQALLQEVVEKIISCQNILYREADKISQWRFFLKYLTLLLNKNFYNSPNSKHSQMTDRSVTQNWILFWEGQNTFWEKENILVMSIFFFPTMFLLCKGSFHYLNFILWSANAFDLESSKIFLFGMTLL